MPGKLVGSAAVQIFSDHESYCSSFSLELDANCHAMSSYVLRKTTSVVMT